MGGGNEVLEPWQRKGVGQGAARGGGWGRGSQRGSLRGKTPPGNHPKETTPGREGNARKKGMRAGSRTKKNALPKAGRNTWAHPHTHTLSLTAGNPRVLQTLGDASLFVGGGGGGEAEERDTDTTQRAQSGNASGKENPTTSPSKIRRDGMKRKGLGRVRCDKHQNCLVSSLCWSGLGVFSNQPHHVASFFPPHALSLHTQQTQGAMATTTTDGAAASCAYVRGPASPCASPFPGPLP